VDVRVASAAAVQWVAVAGIAVVEDHANRPAQPSFTSRGGALGRPAERTRGGERTSPVAPAGSRALRSSPPPSAPCRAGIPRAKIDTLTAWWETELHSEAERAALRYTEALTRAADTDQDAAFQRFHDALAEHFSPEEMLEIVAVVLNMNVSTRLKLAEGAMPGPAD
jgi:hypothetical protein